MPAVTAKGDKKKALLVYKEKLLQDINYYEERIEKARLGLNKSINSFEDDASSDSEVELSIHDTGPPLSQLKNQESMLRTCLQATQELTGLEVLQSEVNVMVQDPDIRGEIPVQEAGVWREVTAECCVDLVQFSITFYAHQANGTFGSISFRGLRVLPLKAAHEAELNKSVLGGLKRPSDAVEVLRSYAVAYRSRRSTLARLADKFGATLFMEPIAEGGYLLKCANLLEVSWTLQNKWSPIAPFHHRMKFDIEYMDETYIKTITQAHRQLSDPAVDTDERTLLLAKIISTCLAAQPESDQEPTPGRRTTLDRECEQPGRRVKDSEVMAPPKSLPKKVRPKSNENQTDVKKPVKRSIQSENYVETSKKVKTNENVDILNKEDKRIGDKNYIEGSKNVANDKNSVQKNVASTKNKKDNLSSKSKSVASATNEGKSKTVVNGVASSRNAEDSAKNADNASISTKKNVNDVDKDKNFEKVVKSKENAPKTSVKDRNAVPQNIPKKSVTTAKNVADKNDNVASSENNNKTAKNKEPSKSVTEKVNQNEPQKKKIASNKKDELKTKVDKNSVATERNEFTKRNSDKIANIANETNKIVKETTTNIKKPLTDNNKGSKIGIASKNGPKLLKQKSTIPTTINKISKTGNTQKENIQSEKISKIPQKKLDAGKNLLTRASPRLIKQKSTIPTITKKISKTGNTQKENIQSEKVSKIPQKTISHTGSPRNIVTKPKLQVLKKKVIKPHVTGVPRLITNPKPKIT